MTITLHTISGAPRPWRVLLALIFKGLEFDTILLQASKQEHKAQPFLAINPRGTVPVLTEGLITIRDSVAALAWLDRAYPEKPLFGPSPEEAARIWQQTTEICDYLRSAASDVMTPVFFQNAETATPDLLNAAERARSELAGLERALEASRFVAGDAPTAADACAFPEVRLLQRANETRAGIMNDLGLKDMYRRYPKLDAWVARIEAWPGYEQTAPQHWKEAA